MASEIVRIQRLTLLLSPTETSGLQSIHIITGSRFSLKYPSVSFLDHLYFLPEYLLMSLDHISKENLYGLLSRKIARTNSILLLGLSIIPYKSFKKRQMKTVV